MLHFQTSRGEKRHQQVDAWNMQTATWPRYVNMARAPSELNVSVCFCRGRVYYIASKHIAPAQELLTYYGPGYASSLGLDPTAFIIEENGRHVTLGFFS